MHLSSDHDTDRSIPSTLTDVVLRALPDWAWLGWRRRELVDQVLERERWSAEQWHDWREARLSRLLEHAATRVPFYREQWARRRRAGDAASHAYLENWPVLEREALRAQPTALLADDRRPGRMRHERTPGTSGEPVGLWWSRRAAVARDALVASRTAAWYGIGPRDRGALVTWADPGAGVPSRHAAGPWPTSQVVRIPVVRPSAEALRTQLAALAHQRVTYLVGRPSVLQLLANEALDAAPVELRVRVVITEREALTAELRCLLGEAFRCPVRETYRTTEMVAAASECLAGRLHEWPDVGIVEVLDGTRSVEVDGAGDLVCTGLLNMDMPLVRYRVGDRVRMRLATHACHCGRALPTFVRIDGRAGDAETAGDGHHGAPAGAPRGAGPLRERHAGHAAPDLVSAAALRRTAT